MELRRRRRDLLPLAALLAAVALGACAPAAAPEAGAGPGASDQASPLPVPSARVGTPGPTQRVRFVPAAVVLPGGARAAVQAAATAEGDLVVPENVRHVGWWDGGAQAGDLFGAVVLAGHVDSASQGLGFFARLLRVQAGDVVTLRDGEHRQRYRVTSVKTVGKQALATSSAAFDQTGDHRLVLITCTGRYRPERGGYDSNLVVTATPLGAAR